MLRSLDTFFRFLKLLVLASAVVFPLGIWIVHSSWANRWILTQATEYADGVGVELFVGELSYNLLQQSLDIHGLTVTAKGSKAPFVRAERISARYDYPGLQSLSLSLVRNLEIQGLQVDIRRGEDGTLNFPESSKPANSSALGMPLHASMRNIHFSYLDAAGNRLTLPSLALESTQGTWKATLLSPGEFNKIAIPALSASGNLPQFELALFNATGVLSLANIRVGTGQRELPPLSMEAGFSFDAKQRELRLSKVLATSRLGSISAQGRISFRAGEPSAVTFRAVGQNLIADGKATWPSLNWEAFAGQAEFTSTRRDVWGQAAATFDRHRVRAKILSASHKWANARGNIEVELPSLALTGELAGHLRALPGIKGTTDFRSHLSGTVEEPRIQAALSSTSLSAGSLTNLDLKARVAFHRPILTIQEAALGWNGQRLQVAGEVRPASPGDAALDLDLTASSVDLSGLLQDPNVQGQAAFQASITGTLAKPVTEGTVAGASLIAYGEVFGPWSTRFAGEGTRFDVPSFVLAKGTGRIVTGGSVNLDDRTYRVRSTSQALRLEDSNRLSALLPDLRGDLEAILTGEGSLDDPRASLSVRTSGSAQISAVLDRTGMEYQASTPVALTLEPVPGVMLAGKPNAKGSLLWASPETSPAEITIEGLSVQSAGHELRVAGAGGAIRLAMDGTKLALVSPVTMESEGARLTVEGALPLRPGYGDGRLSLHGDVPLALSERHLKGMHWKGRAAIDGEINGSVASPHPLVTVRIAGAELTAPEVLHSERVRDIAAEIQITGQRIGMNQFSANLLAGRLQGSGWLTYGGNRTPAFEWRGGLDQVNPSALFLPDPQSQWLATLSGDLRLWSEALHTIDDLRAEARLSELRFRTPTASASQTVPSELRLENGRLQIAHLELESDQGKFAANGSVGLTGGQPLALRLGGKLEASLFAPAAQTASMVAGPVDVALAIAGTMSAPEVTGSAQWTQGRLVLGSPVAIAGDGIEVKAAFDGNSVRFESARGSFNGSPVTGSGTFALGSGRAISALDVHLSGRGLYLDVPKGFQSASDFDLRVQGEAEGGITAKGRILVLDGAYREGTNLAALATSLLASKQTAGSSGSNFLSQVRYDVQIDTQRPLIVDNNLGRLTADAELRLVGPASNPSITGRLEIEEGSRVYFAGRTFQVNQGIVDFTDETHIAPRFNLEAESTINSYLVTLKVAGDADRTETTLTSEPALPEEQVRSLLFTGNPETTGTSSAFAQTQALSLFGSGVTGGFTTFLRNKLGLSDFRIDPSLISADKDPTARLTIGQNLTPGFRLAYSTNLTNAQDQIWTAEYDWHRRFLARFFRESNQSNRLELRHKLRLGGGEKTGDVTTRRPRKRFRIQNIEVVGDAGFEGETIRRELRMRPGQSYDFLRSQAALERLRSFYAKKGYWQARVFQERSNGTSPEDGVTLTYHIDASRPVRFSYEGASIPNRVKDRVGRLWQDSIVDSQRLASTSREVQSHLIRKGHAEAQVHASIRETQDSRTVVFDIEPGRSYGVPRVAFPGVHGPLLLDLQLLLLRTRLDLQAAANPSIVVSAITGHLQNLGYLAAKVHPPEIGQSSGRRGVHISVPVELGQLFTLGEMVFEGANVLPEARLRAAAGLQTGERYLSADRFAIAHNIERAYWNEGYREAQVAVEESLQSSTGKANLLFRVNEGRRVRAGAIHVQGVSSTSEEFVRKRMTISPGSPLSADQVSRSRKNLLDSTAYNRIDFTFEKARQPDAASNDIVENILVSVREPKPYRIDLGAIYDTGRGIGTLLDVSATNLFREARTLGFRATLDRQKRDFRLYFTQPFLGKERLLSTGTAYRTLEELGPLHTDITGLSLQQSWRFKPKWNLTYGYQLEVATVSAALQGFQLSFSGRASSAISTLLYDSRDTVLDATKGTFLSSAIEYGPRLLGGTLGYYKAYWQASRYFGLSKPQVIPFEGIGTRRSRFVFASNVRIGLANTLGANELLPTDRFYAGGGTSVRGYSQNSIGPAFVEGSPAGGGATFILNNELRLPLFGPLEGVPFVDVGNVWEKPSDVSFSGLRTGAGFGLRIRNPIVLLRFDYGWKVGRRPGESRGAFFFSIGQTF